MNNIDVDGNHMINFFVFNFNKSVWFKGCETNVFFHWHILIYQVYFLILFPVRLMK